MSRKSVASMGMLTVLLLMANASTSVAAEDFANVCRTGNAQQIEQAIKAGANVNAESESGTTPLHFAAARNPKPEVIAALAKAGADANAKNKNGATPLTLAVEFNANPDIITALVKAGANVNAKDNDGESVLDYGRKNKNSRIVTELIKAGAK